MNRRKFFAAGAVDGLSGSFLFDFSAPGKAQALYAEIPPHLWQFKNSALEVAQ
jgi:hypothetical protein